MTRSGNWRAKARFTHGIFARYRYVVEMAQDPRDPQDPKDSKIALELPDFQLESPPSAGEGVAGAGFFSDDSVAGAVARGAAVEGFLLALTQNLSFQDFTREILLAIMKSVKCEAGSILELDEPRQQFFFRAVVGQSSDRLTEFRVPQREGLVGHVGETRLPLIVDDLHHNAKHLRSISDAVGFEARNLIAIPMVIRGKLYGVIELLNRIGEQSFTPEDQDLLIALIPLACRAIEIRLMLAYERKAAA